MYIYVGSESWYIGEKSINIIQNSDVFADVSLRDKEITLHNSKIFVLKDVSADVGVPGGAPKVWAVVCFANICCMISIGMVLSKINNILKKIEKIRSFLHFYLEFVSDL